MSAGKENDNVALGAFDDVYYAYQIDDNRVNWYAESPVPRWLVEPLGGDFFHRVGGVHLWVLLPADWEPIGARRLDHPIRPGTSASSATVTVKQYLSADFGEDGDVRQRSYRGFSWPESDWKT